MFQAVAARERGEGVEGRGRFRGEEMMLGAEKERLERVIWGEGGDLGEAQGFEAVVERGGGVFIPAGWWHAVRGVGGKVVGSANWWFR